MEPAWRAPPTLRRCPCCCRAAAVRPLIRALWPPPRLVGADPARPWPHRADGARHRSRARPVAVRDGGTLRGSVGCAEVDSL
jgi:hypothetical protein